jgi:co-chaperonin GroES (HSP10)
MSSDVAVAVGDPHDPKTIRLLGHNVYVRRCRVPEIKREDGTVLIALTDQTQNSSNCAEVLAIGPKVGKPRAGKLPPGVVLCYNSDAIKVGDFVYLPTQSRNGLMWRGGLGADYELIVDESELIAVIPQEDAHG